MSSLTETSDKLVAIPSWWMEGDRVLGVALVAAKATENHMEKVHAKNPDDAGVTRMYERAKLRVQALERAVVEWKDIQKPLG